MNAMPARSRTVRAYRSPVVVAFSKAREMALRVVVVVSHVHLVVCCISFWIQNLKPSRVENFVQHSVERAR